MGQYELARRVRCGISFKKRFVKSRLFSCFVFFRVNVLYLCYLLLRQLEYLPKFGLFGRQMEKTIWEFVLPCVSSILLFVDV